MYSEAVLREQGHAASALFYGAVQTSTRAEVAAGLLTFYSPGKVNILTDSESFVKGFERLQRRIKEGGYNKPWAAIRDGDLWRMWERNMRARGVDTVTVRWTKGHATEQDVASGVCSSEDRMGNAAADSLADCGALRAEYGKDAHRYMTLMQARHGLYSALVHRIHVHQLAVMERVSAAVRGPMSSVTPPRPPRRLRRQAPELIKAN